MAEWLRPMVANHLFAGSIPVRLSKKGTSMEWRYKEWILCPNCGKRMKPELLGFDKIYFGYICECKTEIKGMSKHLMFGQGNNLKL